MKKSRVLLGIDVGWRTLSVAKIEISNKNNFKVLALNEYDIGQDLPIYKILHLLPEIQSFRSENITDITDVIIEEQIPMAGPAQIANIRAYGIACGLFMFFCRERKNVEFFNNKYKFSEARRIGYKFPNEPVKGMTSGQRRTITKNNALWLTIEWLKHPHSSVHENENYLSFFEEKPKVDRYDKADALSIALACASKKKILDLSIQKEEEEDKKQLKLTQFY